MKRLYLLLLILLWSITNLHAQSKGLDQPHLKAHSPELTQPVKPTSSFAFTFDSAIETNGIGKHTVILKRLSPSKKKIQGNLSIRDKTTLLFSPLKPLKQGTYRLKVKPVKLLTQTDTSFTPKTWWQKFVVWLCSLFYDDIR